MGDLLALLYLAAAGGIVVLLYQGVRALVFISRSLTEISTSLAAISQNLVRRNQI